MNEEVSIQQTQGRMRQDVSVKVQEELSIAGITEATIDALRVEAAALTAHEVDSEASLKPIQAVLTKCVRMRGEIVKAIEPGKKWAHMLHKAYTSNEKEFTGTIEEIEEPLKAKKAAYQSRKEAEEQEQLQREQERINARNRELEDLGFVFRSADGMGEASYRIGDTIIIASTIAEADDSQWENLTRSARTVAEEAKAKKEAEEAAAKAEAERVEAEKRDLEAREAKLKTMILTARIAELKGIGLVEEAGGYLSVIDKTSGIATRAHAIRSSLLADITDEDYEREKARARLAMDGITNNAYIAEVNKERKAELIALGAEESADHHTLLVPDGPHGDVVYIIRDLHTYKDWDRKIEIAKSGVAAREEAQARERLVTERVEKLKAAGWSMGTVVHEDASIEVMYIDTEAGAIHTFAKTELPHMDEGYVLDLIAKGQAELDRRKTEQEERLRKEGEERERERQRLAAKAEQERLDDQRKAAQMSDTEKWQQFVEACASAAPTMDSEIGKHAVQRVIAGMEKMTTSLLEDLKK